MSVELAILIVLSVILLQASFLAIAPRTYLRIRNWILRTPNRVPVNRGYGRERAVGVFVIAIAGLIIYWIIYWIISSAVVDVPCRRVPHPAQRGINGGDWFVELGFGGIGQDKNENRSCKHSLGSSTLSVVSVAVGLRGP